MVSVQPTRKVVARLRAAGFDRRRTVGSHSTWEKNSVTVTIPDGHRMISPGVVRQVDKAIKEAES